MARTVGERDRARSSEVSRPRSEERLAGRYRAREERKAARAEAGERPRIEEATSIDEALEAEREAGRAEGRSEHPAAPAPAASSSAGPSSSFTIPTGGSLQIGAPLAVETLIITADELANLHRFPLPSRLLVAWALFTALGMARPGPARQAAVTVAWGLVIATFYSSVAPGQNALTTLGAFVGGKYATPGATLASSPSSASLAGAEAGTQAGTAGGSKTVGL